MRKQFTKKKTYKQGIYTPKNKNKFIMTESSLGGINIIYRSSWEQKFLVWADLHPAILKISSEPFHINYQCVDGKTRRYFPDFLIQVKTDSGKENHLIEVKPYSEVKDVYQGVKMTGNMKESTFIRRTKTAMKNGAKWKYAAEFCRINEMKFKIITEKELFPKKTK